MKKFVVLALSTVVLLAVYYEGGVPKRPVEKSVPPTPSKALVTFVELGSVSCIPCRAMQPVMRDLEKKFGDQIRIVFYDVLQDDAPAKAYNIRVMPTQVFLDQNGREFHRHEGFYPLAEIESLLRARGLKE
ncbi:MAG: thioredoxin family protein [Acidobacteriota bacterium]|jgi:thioredoxin 1